MRRFRDRSPAAVPGTVLRLACAEVNCVVRPVRHGRPTLIGSSKLRNRPDRMLQQAINRRNMLGSGQSAESDQVSSEIEAI